MDQTWQIKKKSNEDEIKINFDFYKIFKIKIKISTKIPEIK